MVSNGSHGSRQRWYKHPAWSTAVLLSTVVVVVLLTAALFSGSFHTYVAVTLKSDRSGLVMEPGGKVKMRGFQIGRVNRVVGNDNAATLELQIEPDQIKYIPANVEAQINATTAFGAKYVDFIYPSHPSPRRLTAGQVLHSRNVTSEVNTVFQNLVNLLDKIDPAKLNGILSTLSEGLRNRGPAIGEATSAASEVLAALNPRTDTIDGDWKALKGFSDSYGSAADNILTVLDAASTTAATITDRSAALDALLLNVIGLSRSGIGLLGASSANLIHDVNTLEPTTALLLKYSPTLTCLLVGAQWFIDHGGSYAEGGNGYSLMLDAGLTWGQDPYRYPDNLPITGAKGGPGGKPGCGSLPDVTKSFPVRQLITNTGWGTGTDIRVNPGIGFPGWANYLPVTRAIPEPPSVRYPGGPAPGPVPYPGAPPYGAPQYAADGTPLYPGLPPAPAPGAPREPGPTPGSEPFNPTVPAQVHPTPLPASPGGG
ncbi:MCE family protein [Mycobacterium camsae]|uniref:MCE family protein n=1 Tax=Mycobacterium gordonae TaxID=1778 RepID=UPI00197FAD66|nr:MCE family protein [Mycobacterium gordonae]